MHSLSETEEVKAPNPPYFQGLAVAGRCQRVSFDVRIMNICCTVASLRLSSLGVLRDTPPGEGDPALPNIGAGQWVLAGSSRASRRDESWPRGQQPIKKGSLAGAGRAAC